LTAAVKVYLKHPDESEDLIATILPLASENNENPDVRDRGYIYWRMLSTDPEKTKRVVLADRPIIIEETHNFEENLLNSLIDNISMVASVFHKPPEAFLPKSVLESAKRYFNNFNTFIFLDTSKKPKKKALLIIRKKSPMR
jgi:AP-1 complex subunit beta-1